MFTRLLGCATIVFALATTLPAAPAGQQMPDQQQAATTQGTPAYNARHVPHMSAALGHLQQAQAELEKATPDKGGHRVKAMDLTKQALDEVQQGIQYYSQNPPEKPKK